MKYYFFEAENTAVYGKAEAFEAKTLTAAKRYAARHMCFYGTIAILGTEVNSDGVIINPVAVRGADGKWTDYDYICDPENEYSSESGMVMVYKK